MKRYRSEYDLKQIGNNLRKCRKRCDLSVEYVRDYLLLSSVQAVYKWEEGRCYPQADTLLALMELYEAELADIIGKNNSQKKQLNHRVNDRNVRLCYNKSVKAADRRRALVVFLYTDLVNG